MKVRGVTGRQGCFPVTLPSSKKIIPMQTYPHGEPEGYGKCHPQDAIIVKEGVQCSKCLALIQAYDDKGPNNPDRRTALRWLNVNPRHCAKWIEKGVLMTAILFNGQRKIQPHDTPVT